MKLESYMGNLAYYTNTDLITRFADYDSGYICDIVSEISDSAISIYTQDQIDFAMENTDAVQEALEEGFMSGIHPEDCGDFRNYVAKAGVAGWYLKNERDIYDNIRECLNYGICEALQRQYGMIEITDEQIEILEHLDLDINDYFEDTIEKAAQELGLITEEEDEEDDID